MDAFVLSAAHRSRRGVILRYAATVAAVTSDHGPFSSRVLTQRRA